MTALTDEFRFLPGDAQRVGRTAPAPRVERVWAEVTEGRRVSGLAFAPERAPAHVFLHGAGLNAHGYDPTILALDAPALSLDLPGHGRSDWRADAAYRPDLLAPDVTLALAHLAPEPVTLVGHSLGGLTAIAVAASRPQAIRELVVLDISPGLVPQRQTGSITDFITGQRDFASHEEMVDRAIAFGIGHDRVSLARGVALNSRQRPDGRWEWTHHLAHLPPAQQTPQGGSLEEEPLPFVSLWQPLGELHDAGLPITLVAASAGIVGPDLVAEWRERLPGSSVVTVEGPHNLHEAAPLEIARLLRK